MLKRLSGASVAHQLRQILALLLNLFQGVRSLPAGIIVLRGRMYTRNDEPELCGIVHGDCIDDLYVNPQIRVERTNSLCYATAQQVWCNWNYRHNEHPDRGQALLLHTKLAHIVRCHGLVTSRCCADEINHTPRRDPPAGRKSDEVVGPSCKNGHCGAPMPTDTRLLGWFEEYCAISELIPNERHCSIEEIRDNNAPFDPGRETVPLLVHNLYKACVGVDVEDADLGGAFPGNVADFFAAVVVKHSALEDLAEEGPCLGREDLSPKCNEPWPDSHILSHLLKCLCGELKAAWLPGDHLEWFL